MQAINKVAIALSAILAWVAAVDALIINTPSGLVQCLNTSISWSGGTPPIYIGAYPKGQNSGTPYVMLPTQDKGSGSYSWQVVLPEGTDTTFGIRDGTGQTQATAAVSVYAKPADANCVTVDTSKVDGGSSTTTGGGSSGTTTDPGTPTNTTSGGGNSASPTGDTGKNSTDTTSSSSNTTSSTGSGTTTPDSTTGSNATDDSTPTTDSTNSTTSNEPSAATRSIRLSVWEQTTIYAIEAGVLTLLMAAMIGAWSF